MNKLTLAMLIILLTACAPAATPAPPTSTPLPPTRTPLPPTATITATPTVTLTPTPSPTATLDPQVVRVTFVGNAGFMVEVGEKKILLDAIFEGIPGYDQPQAVRALLWQALPPFEEADLILVSHSPGDHYYAEKIQAYLEMTPQAVFLSLPDAAGQITGLDERVIPIDLAEGETAQYEVNGMQVEAFYLSHGRVSGESYPNLGFLVTVGDTRIFHTGDMSIFSVSLADLRAFGLPEREISLAFVPHFMMQSVSGVLLAQQGFNASYYFPIHYAYTTPAFDAEVVARYMPEAVVFAQEMESWVRP